MGLGGSKQSSSAGGGPGGDLPAAMMDLRNWGKHQENALLAFFREASAQEVTLLVSQSPPESLCKLMKRKLSSAARAEVLDVLSSKGLTTARAKAAIVQALCRTDLDERAQSALESLFRSTRGEEMTLMKSLVESGRKAVSLQYLLFGRLRDTACAGRIVAHIKEEAARVTEMNLQRGRSALRLLKVVSDIDDTFISMTRDPTYPKTCLYPGVLDFFAALHNPAYSGVPTYLHEAYDGAAGADEEGGRPSEEGAPGEEGGGGLAGLARAHSVPQKLVDDAEVGPASVVDLSAEGPLTPRIASYDWSAGAASSLPPAGGPPEGRTTPQRFLSPPHAPSEPGSSSRHHRSLSEPAPVLPLATPPRRAGQGTPPKAPGSVRSSSSSSSGVAASLPGPPRGKGSPRAAEIRDSLYVTFITARPKMYRKGYYWLTLRQLRRTGVEHVTVLPGSMASVLGGVPGKRDKKVANFGEYQQLFGEFAFVFVGDSGECDVDVARILLDRHPASVAATLIHDVTNTGPEARRELKARGIVYFDTYVGAALEALELGLFNAVCSCRAAGGAEGAAQGSPARRPSASPPGDDTPTRARDSSSPVPLPLAFPPRGPSPAAPHGSPPPLGSPVPMPRAGPGGAVSYAAFQHAPSCRCVATALRIARATVREHGRVSFGLTGQRKKAEQLLVQDLARLNALAPPDERVELAPDRERRQAPSSSGSLRAR